MNPVDKRLALINAPVQTANPLVNYEYAIVSIKQANPETAKAIKRFLLWTFAPDETNESEFWACKANGSAQNAWSRHQ